MTLNRYGAEQKGGTSAFSQDEAEEIVRKMVSGYAFGFCRVRAALGVTA